ncbi:MAG: DMT family transporter [Deltaproteobacteria bacterium]|nr:DMT family transporter [Deltaproteobacteria bacterium]
MALRDLFFPLLAALCYSTNPIFIKFGLRISNEPLLGACIGMTASTVVYLGYFLCSGQGSALFGLPRWVSVYFGLAGLCSTLGVFAFFAAHQYIPASVVAPLTAAAPLVTVTLSHFTLKGEEHVSVADAIGTAMIVAGVALLVS